MKRYKFSKIQNSECLQQNGQNDRIQLPSVFMCCFLKQCSLGCFKAEKTEFGQLLSYFFLLHVYVLVLLSCSRSVIKYDSGLSLMLPCFLF